MAGAQRCGPALALDPYFRSSLLLSSAPRLWEPHSVYNWGEGRRCSVGKLWLMGVLPALEASPSPGADS